MNEVDLRAAMRARFTAISMRGWCGAKGVNAHHLSEFLRGTRGPPSDLLKALNLEIRYVRKRKAAS